MGKPRKPRDIPYVATIDRYFQQYSTKEEVAAHIHQDCHDYSSTKEMRKLAAWLLKAADWLEGRERDE